MNRYHRFSVFDLKQAGDPLTGLGLLGDALELAESRGARLLAGRVRAELVADGVAASRIVW
jgi:hypothetical protein